MTRSPTSSSRRFRVHIQGVVQGVGFRPYLYRLATELGLAGWAINASNGVTVEIEGQETDSFITTLKTAPPPQAQISSIQFEEIKPQHEWGFRIRDSENGDASTTIAADSAICPECLKELFDPTSRYYHYPFTHCSQCGPRYTITTKLPYERHNTTMSKFAMCPDCQQEYSQPDQRRFHAQAIACPRCGPKLSMPVTEMLQRIRAGEILAIKGLGGFHLVCDASNEVAVQTLRQRKQRDTKPLAVMVANLASAEQLAHCLPKEAELLLSPQRPIVILQKNEPSSLAASIAPELNWLGIMLPYTPLHYLLFHEAANRPTGTEWLEKPQPLSLVMTSANPGSEPLVIDNTEAKERLAHIADAIIYHNRTILRRCDDSVLRVVDKQPLFIRRARAYVPQPIKLPHAIPPTLAVGGHLKNTICLTRGNEAFVSQHIGDLDNAATLESFHDTIEQLQTLLNIKPERVAHDLHPDFHSSRYAQSLGLPCFAVQHHHAHLASVAAEHHITEPAIGLALDGFGLGVDQTAWGGELMLLDGPHYQRLGHLKPMKQPGGDVAAKEPWRMASALLHQINRGNEIATRFHTQAAASNIHQLLDKNINSPATSSCGRLFDCAAGLLNIKRTTNYEGQAAMMLESLVTKTEVMHDGWQIRDGQLDLTPLLSQLTEMEPVKGANLFHGTLITALTEWAIETAEQHNIKTVLFSGGCFLNQVLANGLNEKLSQLGLTPLLPKKLPPNDGGIALGQAWIAGIKL